MLRGMFSRGGLLVGRGGGLGSAPGAPTGLVATPGSSAVSLAWTATPLADSYIVRRSTTSGSGYSDVGTPSTNSFNDTGLTNGTPYYYVVAAVNTFGTSSNSAEATATPAAGALLVSLLAYYDFESLLVDVAHANNLSNTNTVTQATGLVGQASSYTAASLQFLGLAGTALLLNTTDFTIAGHVKPSALTGGDATVGRGMISLHSSDAAGSYHIGVKPTGGVECAHWRSSGADATGQHATTATALVADGAWAHIVFRRTASTYTIWVNGTSQAFTNASTSSGWGNTGFRIGSAYTGAAYFWSGLIDQVGLWTRGVTDAEIAFLYNSGSGRSWTEVQAY